MIKVAEYRRSELRIIFFGFFMLTSFGALAEGKIYRMDADDWARPRSGESLIEYPELKALIAEWNLRPNDTIEIYYPGGDMGNLWVSELSDWLVALGVPSVQLHKIPGNAAIDKIELVIVPAVRK